MQALPFHTSCLGCMYYSHNCSTPPSLLAHILCLLLAECLPLGEQNIQSSLVASVKLSQCITLSMRTHHQVACEKSNDVLRNSVCYSYRMHHTYHNSQWPPCAQNIFCNSYFNMWILLSRLANSDTTVLFEVSCLCLSFSMLIQVQNVFFSASNYM